MTDIPLATLASRFRDGTGSARERVEHLIAAFEQGGRELNAFRLWDAEGARSTADRADAELKAGRDRGRLQGLAWSAKDLFATPGHTTFAGSPKAIPESLIPVGPLVNTLTVMLAPLMGKTHTVEFAFGGLGVNTHHGTPRNPRAGRLHRLPGGSSAGAGVSVAAGMADFALGTDTAGSVRIPASWTGLAGLKTTRGRWSTEGIVPLSPSLDSVGVLARSVADLGFVFAALDSRAAPIPAFRPAELRVGRTDSYFWDECSEGVVAAVEAALARLLRAGVAEKRVELTSVGAAAEQFRSGGPVAAELNLFLDRELPEWKSTLDPVVGRRLANAAKLSPEDVEARRQRLRELAELAEAEFNTAGVDVIVTPTVALSPPLLEEVADPADYARLNLVALRNTAIANYLGLCALTVPVGVDAIGMPVGLQLLGRAHHEEQLLGAGLAIERALAPDHNSPA